MQIRLGSTFWLMVFCLVLSLGPGGCRAWRAIDSAEAVPPVPQGRPLNPLPVPKLSRELVMDEISDEIDNYFPILKEERIRDVNGILSEGWIETRPQIGGTILEPWKRDSLPGFEKWHATLQSVRRFAKVRVIPAAENYLVDLKVYKELEDLPQPVGSTVSGRPLRSDNSIDVDDDEIFEVFNRGWIPLGRDFGLEDQILANIDERFREAVRCQQQAQSPSTNSPPRLTIPRIFRGQRAPLGPAR
jgi:hypothetical protein